MRSPWIDIPLADYEEHMALPGVGQAGMLAQEFDGALKEHCPRTVAVVGCAGGNGFDRIPADTRRVVGIDINPAYLEETAARFAGRLPGLELHALDIQAPGLHLEPVELIYAALLFEYVDLAPAFANLGRLCQPGGFLVTVLQAPSASLASVSPSPYATLQALGPVMRLVPPAQLERAAALAGFVAMSRRHLALPSGKTFAVQRFRRATASEARQGPSAG
jgi:SAM-dependent methyltransferase